MQAQLRSVAPIWWSTPAGPFQTYGEQPYAVIEACLSQGCDYLDLADGSDFVAGVSAFDQRAKEAGRFVLSGVSSFPVLTAAVVRRLAADMDEVVSVTGGIAPSPYAGVGLNVIRAISAYAGKPLPLIVEGRPRRGHALTQTRRRTIAPPGGRRSTTGCSRWWTCRTCGCCPALARPAVGVDGGRAGPGGVSPHAHRPGLARAPQACAQPVGPGAAVSPDHQHPALGRASWRDVRRGRGRLGRASGWRAWHMTAEAEDGPYIPSMAVEALVAAVVDGRRPPAGARPAARELELQDYEALFARRRIQTGVWRTPTLGAPLPAAAGRQLGAPAAGPSTDA
jgi:hypothetical protein